MLTSGDIFKFKKLFSDMILGLKMFLRGKLTILPGKIKGVAEVKRIFQLTGDKLDRRRLAIIRLDHGKTKV
jgi:hypothetical protein